MKRRMLARASLIFLLTLGVIIDGPFARASTALSLTASASTVAPGSTIDLTASMPVVSVGSTTQTLTQTIDPTKVKLTSASDITFPAGWTLSYSTDGTTFTSTAPTTTNGWAAITAVRATGSLESSGASNGFQVASRTATGTARSFAPSPITIAGTGDGYQAFFDPARTRVFNVFHHQGSGLGGQLDCYVIATGARCAGFPIDFSSTKTPQSSIGRVVGNKIWIPGYKSGNATTQAVGFYCVDIASVLANGGSPTLCATPFVSMASGTSATIAFAGVNVESALYSFYAITGAGVSGSPAETKLWGVLSFNGNLVCIDTSTQNACAGMPTNGWATGLSVGGFQGRGTDIEFWENRIYIRGNSANTDSSSRVVCRLASDPTQTCPGWSTPFSTNVLNEFVGELIPLPNSTGTKVSMCLGPDGRHTTLKFNSSMLESTTLSAVSCWDSNGVKTDGPASLSKLIVNTWSTNSSHVYLLDHSVTGTRIAWANGVNYVATTPEAPAIACWDASLDGPCTTTALGTTTTANGSVTYIAASGFTGGGAKNYTAVIDPVAPNCLWVMQNDNPRTFHLNVVDGTSNCSAGAPTTASFSGTSIVPRMGCEASSQPIRQWESFKLTSAGTGTFTAAKLTVKNSSGTAIPAWTNVPLTLNMDLNLATLSPTDTGATPTFDVAFEGITGSITTASAQVRVVGDAPQLCTKVTAVYACPSGSGPIASLANNTVTVSASGSSVLNSVTTTLTSASQSLTVTAPALSTCTSSITGRAGDAGGGASGSAIPGVTVSLLDSAANPITVNGTPVTTTTTSDGTYSFANLLPASYKIRFYEPISQVLASSTVVSGASGTTTGAVTVNSAATAVTSNTAATIAGTNAVVNALYSIPASAAADTSTGGQGVAQTINVLANDTAASGATLTATTVKLCGTSPAQTPPSCSQTSLTTADGLYSVNALTGVVTFTPNASFTGTATVVPTYQVTDSASNVISSTITTTVIAAPTASSDTSTGGVNQAQSKNVLANDTAANGSGGFAATNPVALCTFGSTVSCTTGTSLTISGQGTYTVNSSGVITFTPVSGYTGNPTPVSYVVTDALGGKSVSTYQPIVVPAPTATNDTTIGTAGATQSINLLTNDAGAPSSGGLAPTNPVALCTSGTSTSCTTGNTITNSSGTYTLNQTTGVISFTPASGFTGNAPAVTYVVTDALGSKTTATYTPTVVAAPTANADTSSGGVNQSQTKNLITNDSAATGQSIASVGLCTSGSTVTCTTGTTVTDASGTYTVNPATGVVTYVPTSGYTGTPNPISYVITDSLGGKAVSTYTPTVIPAPTATDKNTSGVMGATQTSNLFTGNTVSGAPYSTPGSLTIGLCTSGTTTSCTTGNSITNSSGTYTLNPTRGVIIYVPASGYSGTPQAITYVITDGVGQKVVATYTPTVVPPPTAVADTTTGAWNTTQILNLISNSVGTSDTAGAGSGGFAASNPVKLCGPLDTAPNCSIDSSSSTGLVVAGQGTYRISNNGVVTFTPIPTFTGTATPIRYSVTDSLGQQASTTYTPTVANPNAPLASADATSGPMGAMQSVNVLTNDAPGIANNADLSLVASSVKLCDPTTTPAQVAPNCTATTVNVAGVGSYRVNSSGVLTFTPDANYTGTPTPLSYQVADTTGQVATAAYTPTVIPPPTVVANTSAGAWDTDQTISPLANDTAGNGATLVAGSVKLCAPSDTAPNCTATTLTNSEGTYTVNSDGTVTFDPVASFTGTSTNPVTYSVTDSLNQKSASTITPSVSAPGAPVANPETKMVSPTQTSSFTTITGQGALATGTQLSPSATFLCALSPAQSPPNCNATSVTTADGTWVLSQITGVATYQPAAGASAGTKIAITYQVTDPAGQSASALLTPVIPPAPVANPDTSSGQQGIAQLISLIGNDQPGSASSPLDVSTVKFCVGNQVSPNCSATSLTITGQGTYSIDSLGIVTFTPVASFSGTATPVNYQVSDSVGQTTSSTLSIYVIPPPAPIATRDLGSAAFGQPVVFEPWKNDSGGDKPAGATQPAPDVVPTSIRLCSGLQAAPNCTATSIVTVDGTYTLDTATGKVTFMPVSGFSGTATAPVTYQISNNWTGPSGVATTTAILIPTIAAPGDPLATNDQSSTKPLTPVILKPVLNDTPGSYALNATTLRLCKATDIAPNCSKLSITNSQGKYVVDPNTGYVTFTPANGFKGLASVPYVISDMNARFAHANLFITVSQDATQEITTANKANKKHQTTLAKTGVSGVYELGAIAILAGLTGIALVSTSQRKTARI